MKRDFWDWVITTIVAVILFSLGWSIAYVIIRALEAL